MKYIKTFEENDYLTLLKKDSDLRREMGNYSVPRRREDFLGSIEADSQERRRISKILDDRERLTHLVIQSLIYSSSGDKDFESFQVELEKLLNKYPIHRLPKSGRSIYRKSE